MTSSNYDFVASALEALNQELSTAALLKDTVNSKDFTQACELILNIPGKVVVMGVGKSGHIANKISASLSSTGTPSFYINSAEATHGDLGTIQRDDLVIFISNSGESWEFKSIVSYFKSEAIKIIAMTSNLESHLARHADLVLNLQATVEACPLNLAPTASSTNSLILGDLLVIALLNARQFAASDFAKYHPQGRLGKRLLARVDDLMHHDLPLVTPDDKIAEIVSEMTKHRLGIALVVQQEQLLGLFTDGDLRRLLETGQDIYSLSAQQIMNCQFKTVPLGFNAYQAMILMEQYKIASLPVVDHNNKPLGVVNLYDLLNAGL